MENITDSATTDSATVRISQRSGKGIVDMSDLLVLVVLVLATVAYLTKGKIWALKGSDSSVTGLTKDSSVSPGKTRNIVEKMRESGKNAVVFFGSQTGTAEDYATRLAKEGHQKYGLSTMVADIEDYDFDCLDAFPTDHVAFFVMATYGEGEPTDNAASFVEFIQNSTVQFSTGQLSSGKPLQHLKYVAFGLGNKTYEHYNAVIKKVDAALSALGAQRLGEYGLGNDGDGTMEEDFLTWKDDMWHRVAEILGLEEREAIYEATFQITEDVEQTLDLESVFLGEPNKKHLSRTSKPYNAHNPFIAPVSCSRELFSVKNRNCLHMEIDISGSGLKYKTGDHIAVWPMNTDNEVDRLINVLGLSSRRDVVIKIKSLDSTTKIPVPQPTTYSTVFRYYLEIGAAVSRQLLGTLVQFAPDQAAATEISKLSQDKAYFQQKVSRPHLNLAQMLDYISPKTWNIPFSILLESVSRLQPRYYSVSSSDLVSPDKIHITAIVTTQTFADHSNVLRGVATNYLLALSQEQNGVQDPHPHGVTYAIDGPREKWSGIRLPVHMRSSNFRLPADPSVPIIMVGPGTGVAPFRAFIQERAAQAKEGQAIGRSLLFYGCRKRDEDFLYADEWEDYKRILGNSFNIDVAFSRETPDKIYVQHRLRHRAKEVKEILENGGYFYICGDAAHMARDVNSALIDIMGDDIVKKMRTSQRLLEDVWS